MEGNFRPLGCRIGTGQRYPRRTTQFPVQILCWERVKRPLRARWLQDEQLSDLLIPLLSQTDENAHLLDMYIANAGHNQRLVMTFFVLMSGIGLSALRARSRNASGMLIL